VVSDTDPVLARRERLAEWARRGQLLGAGLLAVAVVAFAVGSVVGFGRPVAAIVTGALAGASVVLAPAIVLGFAVRAAEREDRGSQG
jgi:hypothetical protein